LCSSRSLLRIFEACPNLQQLRLRDQHFHPAIVEDFGPPGSFNISANKLTHLEMDAVGIGVIRDILVSISMPLLKEFSLWSDAIMPTDSIIDLLGIFLESVGRQLEVLELGRYLPMSAMRVLPSHLPSLHRLSLSPWFPDTGAGNSEPIPPIAMPVLE